MYQRKFISLFLFIVIILFYFYALLSRIWVAEDAYITFRHIENFFNGNGLTFNKNYKIEGFTHPLWVLQLLLLGFTGISVHLGSLILGIFYSTVGMGLLLYHFIYKKYKVEFFYKSILIIPLFFIIHDGFRDFWTSGLEFSLTFFLVCLFLVLNANKTLTSPILNSIIFSLLYLTRPELGIYYLYYGLIYVINDFKLNRSFFSVIKIGLKYSIPFILIGGSYHLFRWIYYHDLFPTTFYAKSSEILWKEGILYIFHTLIYSPLLLLTLLIVIVFIIKYHYKNSYFLREIGAIILHVLYLISIGGDFMAYRLLLPDLITLYVYFYITINETVTIRVQKQEFITGINIILLLISIIFLFQFKYHTPIAKYLIVHEYRAYLNKHQTWKEKWFQIKHKWYDRGLIFQKLQACLEYEPFIITNSWLDAKCAPEDDYGLGYFGYSAGSNIILIDQLGITDKEVALTGETVWRRVGHLKSISTENVIKRKVLFCNLLHKEYDSIMMTNFFPVISLDKEFLFRFGSSYKERISKLKELYKKVQKQTTEEDKKLYKYLQIMESTYNTRILDLPDENAPEYKKYDTCWNLHLNDVDPHQYLKKL